MHTKFNTQNNWIGQKNKRVKLRADLLIIYKSFHKHHPDYADVICNHAFNESFQNKLEPVQYNSALAIAGAIKDSSREKLYQELGLESLKSQRRYPKLALFFKLKKMNIPLTSLI